MSWFFSSKPEDPKEKKFKDTIASLQNPDLKDISRLYSELLGFIPEKNEIIIEKLLNNMVVILGKPPVSREVPLSVINVVHKIISNIPKSSWPSTILDQLLNHPKFIPSIFTQAGLDDPKVVEIIDYFNDYKPSKISDFVDRSPLSLTPLIKTMNSSNNSKNADLFIKIVKNKPDKIKPLASILQSNIKQFPSRVTVMLISQVPEFKGANSESLLSSIINERDKSLTISDVREIFKTLPRILNNEDMVKSLLSASHSDDSLSFEAELSWIHSLEPKKFGVSKQTANDCCKILDDADDPKLSFIHLYAASFINPSDFSTETVTRLCFTKDEYVSVAAVQVLCTWLLSSYKVDIPQRIIYLAAAHILDQNIPKEIRVLYKAFLRLLCEKYGIASYIAGNDANLQYDPSENVLMRREFWMFPGFYESLKNIEVIPYIDCSESVEVLGCVAGMLDLVE